MFTLAAHLHVNAAVEANRHGTTPGQTALKNRPAEVGAVNRGGGNQERVQGAAPLPPPSAAVCVRGGATSPLLLHQGSPGI